MQRQRQTAFGWRAASEGLATPRPRPCNNTHDTYSEARPCCLESDRGPTLQRCDGHSDPLPRKRQSRFDCGATPVRLVDRGAGSSVPLTNASTAVSRQRALLSCWCSTNLHRITPKLGREGEGTLFVDKAQSRHAVGFCWRAHCGSRFDTLGAVGPARHSASGLRPARSRSPMIAGWYMSFELASKPRLHWTAHIMPVCPDGEHCPVFPTAPMASASQLTANPAPGPILQE